MNRTVKNYVDSIVALMPEIEDWQLTGIQNALEELYCLAYREGQLRGRINTLEDKKLFDNYDYAD